MPTLHATVCKHVRLVKMTTGTPTETPTNTHLSPNTQTKLDYFSNLLDVDVKEREVSYGNYCFTKLITLISYLKTTYLRNTFLLFFFCCLSNFPCCLQIIFPQFLLRCIFHLFTVFTYLKKNLQRSYQSKTTGNYNHQTCETCPFGSITFHFDFMSAIEKFRWR